MCCCIFRTKHDDKKPDPYFSVILAQCLDEHRLSLDKRLSDIEMQIKEYKNTAKRKYNRGDKAEALHEMRKMDKLRKEDLIEIQREKQSVELLMAPSYECHCRHGLHADHKCVFGFTRELHSSFLNPANVSFPGSIISMIFSYYFISPWRKEPSVTEVVNEMQEVSEFLWQNPNDLFDIDEDQLEADLAELNDMML